MMQRLFVAKGNLVALSLTHVIFLNALNQPAEKFYVYTDLVKGKIWFEQNN